jgi:hypothetical protein
MIRPKSTHESAGSRRAVAADGPENREIVPFDMARPAGEANQDNRTRREIPSQNLLPFPQMTGMACSRIATIDCTAEGTANIRRVPLLYAKPTIEINSTGDLAGGYTRGRKPFRQWMRLGILRQ